MVAFGEGLCKETASFLFEEGGPLAQYMEVVCSSANFEEPTYEGFVSLHPFREVERADACQRPACI